MARNDLSPRSPLISEASSYTPPMTSEDYLEHERQSSIPSTSTGTDDPADKASNGNSVVLLDETYLRILETDPTAAADILQPFALKSALSLDLKEKTSLATKLRTVADFVVKQRTSSGKSAGILLRRSGFMNVVMPIVLDEVNYRGPQDPCSDEEVSFCRGLLYVAINLFTYDLQALVADDLARESLNLDRNVLLQSARTFWRFLWIHRRALTDPTQHVTAATSTSSAIESKERYIFTIADCLNALGRLCQHTVTDDAPVFGSQYKVEQDAMNAHLLYWLYCTYIGDLERAEELFCWLHQDSLPFSARHPDEFIAWYQRVSRDAFQGISVSQALRSNFLHRNLYPKFHSALLSFWIVVEASDSFQQELNGSWATTRDPVYWVVKAMQRQICELGCQGLALTLPLAVEGLTRRCGRHRQTLVEVLHCDYKIPLLPYLGPLAIICADPENDDFRGIFESTVSSCVAFVRSASSSGARAAAALKIMRDPTVGRSWKQALLRLFQKPPTVGCREVTGHWIRLGQALGWDALFVVERPVPWTSVPWGHCGWTGCFCYQQIPLFRLVACKGCWRVYYCGKVCQKKDWEDGHRDRCLRLNEVDDRLAGGQIFRLASMIVDRSRALGSTHSGQRH